MKLKATGTIRVGDRVFKKGATVTTGDLADLRARGRVSPDGNPEPKQEGGRRRAEGGGEGLTSADMTAALGGSADRQEGGAAPAKKATATPKAAPTKPSVGSAKPADAASSASSSSSSEGSGK